MFNLFNSYTSYILDNSKTILNTLNEGFHQYDFSKVGHYIQNKAVDMLTTTALSYTLQLTSPLLGPVGLLFTNSLINQLIISLGKDIFSAGQKLYTGESTIEDFKINKQDALEYLSDKAIELITATLISKATDFIIDLNNSNNTINFYDIYTEGGFRNIIIDTDFTITGLIQTSKDTIDNFKYVFKDNAVEYIKAAKNILSYKATDQILYEFSDFVTEYAFSSLDNYFTF